MSKEIKQNVDEGLNGNNKIEEAIYLLQQSPTDDELAYTLTVLRRRMKEGGQFIISVEPSLTTDSMQIKTYETEDGKTWWLVFTSFEEELKGSDNIKSTFLSDIRKIFDAALSENQIDGIIINPWNRTLMLSKNLIKIVIGNL